MNIVLIGYRGCGKSTIGRKLANQLSMRFVDLDDEVCRFFGDKTIKQIWEEFGEPAFRKLECFILRRLVQDQKQVISLGGGTVMQDRCRQVVLKAEPALRVYLKCDPRELHRRVLADPKFTQTRPNKPDPKTGLKTITEILAHRDPIYQAVSDTIIDVTDLPIDHAVTQIIKQFEGRAGHGSERSE